MKKTTLLFLIICLFKLQGFTQSSQNAAPSQHLPTKFDSKAILMTQRVKVIESAGTEYFSILNYRGGYGGIQQGVISKKLLASLWNNNATSFASVTYTDPSTTSTNFTGEGEGAKAENTTYNWSLNVWYTFVVRSWKVGYTIYIASFIRNDATSQWFHTATLSRADTTGDFLGKVGDAFMENWASTNPAYDGRFKRKAFFKDYWIIDTAGNWKKPYKIEFYANSNDSVRNGLYNWSFNAGYDATEDAYLMEHGGDVTPSAAFGTRGRYLLLPLQTNQGTAPVLTVGTVTSATASYTSGTTSVNWVVDLTKSPQLSSKVEILNAAGTVVSTINEILPQKRQALIASTLASGNYTARVTITDIFNQVAAPVSAPFTVGTTSPAPVVSISSPANNATFTAPASVTINATATVSSGTISKVEFFQGVTKLGEDLTSPYSYSWTGVAAGTYALTAKATSNTNAVTTSSFKNITVNAASVCNNSLEPNATLGAAIAITTSSTLKSQIASSTDLDWFKFIPTTNGTVTITLTTLPFDYDIFLHNASNNQLASSEAGGTANESFPYNVSAGVTYYIKILGYQNVFSTTSCYTLTVSGVAPAMASNQPVSNQSESIQSVSVKAKTVKGEGLSVAASPNPSNGEFNLSIKSNSTEKVQIRVMDLNGRLLKTINSNVGAPIQFGRSMKAGTYLIEVKQGTEKKIVKVVKL